MGMFKSLCFDMRDVALILAMRVSCGDGYQGCGFQGVIGVYSSSRHRIGEASGGELGR